MVPFLSKEHTRRKLRGGLLLLMLLLPAAMGAFSMIDQQFWVGVNELLLNSDCPDGIRVGVSVYGVVHTAMEVAVWSFCFGGIAGAAAGIVAGL